MDTLHRIWAGLDVHKDTVVACVRRLDDRDRDRVHTEVRTFGTTTAPGISRRTAEVVLAEIGGDMGRFGTAGRLASWGGLCPGNNESAGKRRGGRTTRGDRWLRVALVQAAWAASRARKTYLARAVSAAGEAARPEEGVDSGGPHAVGHVLPGAEKGSAVPGTVAGIPRPVGAGASHPPVGAATGKPGSQGHPRTEGRRLSCRGIFTTAG